MVWTFSCSTSRRTLVTAPVGSGSESSTMTFTSRPATLLPTSSQKRLKPSVMSFPVWEKLPVRGPKYPMRMGSAARAGRTAAAAATPVMVARNCRLCMGSSPGPARYSTCLGVLGPLPYHARPGSRRFAGQGRRSGRQSLHMPRAAMVRLLTVWAVVALALPLWAALTAARGPGRPVPSGAVVLPRPPAAPILALWVRWQAPPGSLGWVALEPDGIGASASDEAYRRRRLHPGWNQLI